jgi:putative DNA primase/helicase
MADPSQSTNVHRMSIPTDMDNDGAPAAQPGAGGRPKRKKKLDTGKLQTLFRSWALQYCSQIAWDTETRQAYAIAGLRNQFGNDEIRMWLQSDKRRVVKAEQVVFDPSGKCGPGCINLYAGLETVPMAGDCEPILELLRHLVGDVEIVYDWILDWIAYPLQNPGAKMPTSVIMHGDEGSGKNLLWEIVRDIYGEYGSVVGQDQLEDKFNDWISRKLFIIGDEVLSRQEMRHLKGKLKAMISGREIKINTKMMPVRSEANHVNLVFLSNELQPNALDASDRRYCVVWTPPKKEPAYYQAVVACRDGGGREAFMDFLLKRDLSRFEPYTPPPVTVAKADLIDLGRPNPERWFLAWSKGELAVSFKSCSADQAYRLYRRWCTVEGEKYPMSKIVFGRMVMRQAADALVVRVVTPKGMKVATRMWWQSPAPIGEVGAAALTAIELFEADLKPYIGSDFMSNKGGAGHD